MVWKHVVGQEHTKKHLEYLISSSQVPHAQLFISPSGFGGLPLAIEFCLGLLETDINPDQQIKLGKSAQHPDLHFVYPVVKRGSEKITTSQDYAREWTAFLDQQPYGNYTDWFDLIDVGNKQGMIGVSEIEKLHHTLYLKTFSGGNKICVLWGLEKMNASASNAFLKLLEEPPQNTYFILLAESIENVLPTVLSRCQEISLGPIEEAALAKEISDTNPSKRQLLIQANGSLRKLYKLMGNEEEKEYETLLLEGLRYAFKAKGNKAVVVDLMKWSGDIAVLGREKQKSFLSFGIQLFRDAFLTNYNTSNLVHYQSGSGFKIEKLAPYVHSSNVIPLINLFEEHNYFIQRNANAKMLFAEMALQLTRLINQPNS